MCGPSSFTSIFLIVPIRTQRRQYERIKCEPQELKQYSVLPRTTSNLTVNCDGIINHKGIRRGASLGHEPWYSDFLLHLSLQSRRLLKVIFAYKITAVSSAQPSWGSTWCGGQTWNMATSQGCEGPQFHSKTAGEAN